MNVQIVKNKALCSGKFYSVNKPTNVPIDWTVGYMYNATGAGVFVQMMNPEQKQMRLALTPEEADLMATRLQEYAAMARKYQTGS